MMKNLARRIALVEGNKKREHCKKTVLPVRFAAFQLLLVLPAHPWQLFLWSCDLVHPELLHPAHITPMWKLHPEVSWPSWPAEHPDRLSFSVLEVSFNASSVFLFASSWSLSLQHRPGVSRWRAIILMFSSLCDSLSTDIESPVSLCLTRCLQAYPYDYFRMKVDNKRLTNWIIINYYFINSLSLYLSPGNVLQGL